MALIFLGSSICGVCGKTLLEGEDIVGLPALLEPNHYLDKGFHFSCFEQWDKKEEIIKVMEA